MHLIPKLLIREKNYFGVSYQPENQRKAHAAFLYDLSELGKALVHVSGVVIS